jgi:Flp pilus assembly protein TadD
MVDRRTLLTSLPIRTGPAAVALWVLATVGCAMQSPFQTSGSLEYEPSLVTGERLFGAAIPPAELPHVRVNEASPPMRDYVASLTENARLSSQRFRSLMAGLHRDGYFDAVYSAESTFTAAQTFESKGGNCLSYTNMFVALAREAGMDARYQIVDVPASWDADAEFLIRYTHINVLLKNVSVANQPGQSVVVDFNRVHPEADYATRVVSDDYAESLYYANQSVNLLRAGEVREAFAYLRRALETAPENADLWVNLGALYATQRDYDSSIEAYEVALQIEPRNRSAVSGLARSYANTGNVELAEAYDRKVRNYRQRNPYYHYALAQGAFEQADFEGSLEFISEALRLQRRSPRFLLFKGIVEQQLGRTEDADDSFRRAQRYGLDQRVKLDVLSIIGGVTSS